MLIPDINGRYWRVDLFDCFTPSEDGRFLDALRRRSVHFECRARFDTYQWKAVRAAFSRTVPCAPGHYALVPIYDDSGPTELLRIPIIAWRFELNDIQPLAYSILPESCPVLFPDGTVSNGTDTCCLEDFESQFARQLRRTRGGA